MGQGGGGIDVADEVLGEEVGRPCTRTNRSGPESCTSPERPGRPGTAGRPPHPGGSRNGSRRDGWAGGQRRSTRRGSVLPDPTGPSRSRSGPPPAPPGSRASSLPARATHRGAPGPGRTSSASSPQPVGHATGADNGRPQFREVLSARRVWARPAAARRSPAAAPEPERPGAQDGAVGEAERRSQLCRAAGGHGGAEASIAASMAAETPSSLRLIRPVARFAASPPPCWQQSTPASAPP